MLQWLALRSDFLKTEQPHSWPLELARLLVTTYKEKTMRFLSNIFLLALLVTASSSPENGAVLRSNRGLQDGGNVTETLSPTGIINAEETLAPVPETCPPCPQCQAESTRAPENISAEEEPLTLQILVVDSIGIINMVAWNGRDYEEFTGGKVKIEIKTTATMPALYEEIENDARTGASLDWP